LSKHLDRTYPALITLGSNIAPEVNLPRAVAMLRQNHHLVVRAVSRVYESAPINAAGAVNPDQAAVLNAAAWIDTDYYGPLALKFVILRFIELCLGRERGPDKYAPRPIDLDLALYGDRVQSGPVTLPDPDILTRAHVALPLADVAPEWVHPVTGERLAAIAARFADTPGIVVRESVRLA